MKNSIKYSLIVFLLSMTCWIDAAVPVISKITPEESAGLKQMKEEEKMAHDVYTALYDKWGLPVFRNIAESEKRHMEALDLLLNEFEIEDPATDQPGVFSDPDIQQLHDQLIEKGSASITGALEVGATIEDLDIKDLDDLMEKTENETIRDIYENLNKGSRNHLRSFYALLQDKDIDYAPNYLSPARFNAIVNGSMERGGNRNEVNQAFCRQDNMGRRSNGQVSGQKNPKKGKRNGMRNAGAGRKGTGCMGNQKGNCTRGNRRQI
jgi:hypothetical protein